MKKILSFVLVTMIIMLSIGTVSAYDPSSETSQITCDIDIAKIFLNNKKLKIGTIKYTDEIYIKLNDAIRFFKGKLQVNSVAKEINIIPVKAKNVNLFYNVKLTAKINTSIDVSLNKYIIKFDGLNEYINNIEYKNSVYVSARYFGEMFDKTVNYSTEGNVELSDVSDVSIGSVNSTIVTERELFYIYSQYASTYASATEDEKLKFKQSIFDGLVTRKLILQKGKAENINLTTEDTNKINSEDILSTVNQFGGISDFRKILKSNDTTFHQFALFLQDSYLCDKIISHYLENVKKTSEDDLKQYYNDNISQYTQLEKVTAKHILFKIIDDQNNPYTDEKKAEAKKKAIDILNRLKNGEDFDTLMYKYSEDPGLLQSFGKGEMVKPFEDAAFSLKPDEISDIVETIYGYHIIKLIEKTPEKQLSFDEVKDTIKTKLDSTNKTTYYKNLIATWKTESSIEQTIK